MTLPTLGVGIVYARGLEPLLEEEPELVSLLEIEPQTLWLEAPQACDPYRADGEAVRALARLPQRKLIHGVGFPVGGSRVPDERSLPLLRAMIDTLEAPWASEHLSFNEAAGSEGPFKTGFLLPPRQSTGGASTTAATVRRVARQLPVPFAIETGVNYLRPRADELRDGEFVAAVADQADCGILLDLHNVYVNERNGRQPARDFLAELPLERVWEIHVAGGFEFEGYSLDAHSGEVPEPLMTLATEVVRTLPNLRALTFELGPDYIPHLGLDGIREQLVALRRIWDMRATDAPRRRMKRNPTPSDDGPSPAEWENALGALVIGRPANSSLALTLADDPGVAILRRLVEEVRSGMVVDALRLTSNLLVISLGKDGLRSLLEEFWSAAAPQLFGATEAAAFAAFLAERENDVPYLPEVLGYERAVLHAHLNGEGTVVPFTHEPVELLTALKEGRLPEPVTLGEYEVPVKPDRLTAA